MTGESKWSTEQPSDENPGLTSFVDQSGDVIIMLVVLVCLIWILFIFRACCVGRLEPRRLGRRTRTCDSDVQHENLCSDSQSLSVQIGYDPRDLPPSYEEVTRGYKEHYVDTESIAVSSIPASTQRNQFIAFNQHVD